MNDTAPPPGFRYDPPRLQMLDAGFDETGLHLADASVHLLLPRAPTEGEEALVGSQTGPDPYVEYDRRYTAAGGIELSYLSNDLTFMRILWRIACGVSILSIVTLGMLKLFAVSNGCAEIPACTYTDDQWRHGWTGFIGLAAILIFVFSLPLHVVHTIEIRPDCLILDREDVFWSGHMESRPVFRLNEDGAHVLRGIYGTRRVEFLVLRPVDENDATPTVLANHVEEAFQQLWDRPQAWAGA